jgi:hypothetical protein
MMVEVFFIFRCKPFIGYMWLTKIGAKGRCETEIR